LEVASEFIAEVEAVAHPPGAARRCRRVGLGFAFDGSQRIAGGRVEAFELQARELVALLCGMDEGEDDGLRPIPIDGLRRREFAAVARRDEPVEIALHDGRLYFVISRDEAPGGGRLFVRPFRNVGADAERALQGAEHGVGERRGAFIDPVGRVCDPGHHDLRRVGVAEAVLLREAVEGIGVV
jgi:hypothetical protein